MEQERPLTHSIFLDDTVVIRRKFEIPTTCPRCKTKLDLGQAVVQSQTLRPREKQLMLTTLLHEGTVHEVVSVKNVNHYGTNPRLILDVKCINCGHVLAAAHSRTHELLEMDRTMAFKLRGLLYDRNARDPQVRKKCYDETEGYHGDCFECNIEAEIGTEEVPHPIDARVHSCKNKGE